ncbi:hypothetical protein HNP46_000487 [Pseudomonas nitritireducens]|uniref:Uncharacterized protein n=1 Tax=Pseudomonas nitroreducens TaxID=46680 RepID=A0A7W7KFT9_PSENT|nr:hypothetical protein [Pseudomonas nitritireducens]MBB4861676.1 hypothetical protein [Pseudomonas nitritireducens]
MADIETAAHDHLDELIGRLKDRPVPAQLLADIRSAWDSLEEKPANAFAEVERRAGDHRDPDLLALMIGMAGKDHSKACILDLDFLTRVLDGTWANRSDPLPRAFADLLKMACKHYGHSFEMFIIEHAFGALQAHAINRSSLRDAYDSLRAGINVARQVLSSQVLDDPRLGDRVIASLPSNGAGLLGDLPFLLQFVHEHLKFDPQRSGPTLLALAKQSKELAEAVGQMLPENTSFNTLELIRSGIGTQDKHAVQALLIKQPDKALASINQMGDIEFTRAMNLDCLQVLLTGEWIGFDESFDVACDPNVRQELKQILSRLLDNPVLRHRVLRHPDLIQRPPAKPAYFLARELVAELHPAGGVSFPLPERMHFMNSASVEADMIRLVKRSGFRGPLASQALEIRDVVAKNLIGPASQLPKLLPAEVMLSCGMTNLQAEGAELATYLAIQFAIETATRTAYGYNAKLRCVDPESPVANLPVHTLFPDNLLAMTGGAIDVVNALIESADPALVQAICTANPDNVAGAIRKGILDVSLMHLTSEANQTRFMSEGFDL